MKHGFAGLDVESRREGVPRFIVLGQQHVNSRRVASMSARAGKHCGECTNRGCPVHARVGEGRRVEDAAPKLSAISGSNEVQFRGGACLNAVTAPNGPED